MKPLGVLPGASMKRSKLPTLVDLCVQTAIDNLQHIGDVGETDLGLLARILPHCNVEQLHRIETSSKRRDLTSITNDLWCKFYTRKFGADNANLVLERMKKKKVSFKWHLLYQAKMREQEEVQKKCVDRLKQLYMEADIQKQSRQTQLCSKVPPSKKRRTSDFGGGSSSNQFAHVKGRLMKKARIEFAASFDNKVSKVRLQSSSSKLPPVLPSKVPAKPQTVVPCAPNSLKASVKSQTIAKFDVQKSQRSTSTLQNSKALPSQAKLGKLYKRGPMQRASMA